MRCLDLRKHKTPPKTPDGPLTNYIAIVPILLLAVHCEIHFYLVFYHSLSIFLSLPLSISICLSVLFYLYVSCIYYLDFTHILGRPYTYLFSSLYLFCFVLSWFLPCPIQIKERFIVCLLDIFICIFNNQASPHFRLMM